MRGGLSWQNGIWKFVIRSIVSAESGGQRWGRKESGAHVQCHHDPRNWSSGQGIPRCQLYLHHYRRARRRQEGDRAARVAHRWRTKIGPSHSHSAQYTRTHHCLCQFTWKLRQSVKSAAAALRAESGRIPRRQESGGEGESYCQFAFWQGVDSGGNWPGRPWSGC